MKCRNAKKLIFDFIDGLEDDSQRLNLEEHLSQCAECDKLASQLARSMDLVHRTPQESPSENFAWKVRLKINQEKNAIRERSESYGGMIRSWNIRYTATAVAAAAVVTVVGLFAVRSGLSPVPPSGAEFGAETQLRTDGRDVADAQRSRGDEVRSDRDRTAAPVHPPEPDLGVGWTLDRSHTKFIPTSPGASPGSISSQMLGLIDRRAPMSVAELDSIVSVELSGLTPDEKRQLLSQYMHVLQRQLLQAGMRVQTNRR